MNIDAKFQETGTEFDADFGDVVILKGDKGDKGDPGYSPVKGVDYLTESDKEEIRKGLVKSVNGVAPDANGNVQLKPKLLWELRVPGRAQGFTGYQQWDGEFKRFLSVDIYWKPVPWNKEWWRDPQLPADTNLYDIFMELFACLEGKIPVYMEFELNGFIYAGGYPTLTRFQAAEDNEICKLMICAPDPTIPMTTYSDLTVLEATPHGLNCSFAVGEVAQENGWAVRVYGISQTGSDGADDDSGTEGDSSDKIIEFNIFTADGEARIYYALDGMTWEEWCDSEYNTDAFFLVDDSIRNDAGYYVSPDEGTTIARPGDLIIELYDYYTYEA